MILIKPIRQIKNYFEFGIFFILKKILPNAEIKKNTVLFVNTGEIGDLIVSSILLENPQILESYPRVDFLIKEKYLQLFQNYSGKIDFIGYNYLKYKYSIKYKYNLIRNLRKKGYEKCIHLSAAKGILNEELVHLIGAKELITINNFVKYLGSRLGKYFLKNYTYILAEEVLNEYAKHYALMKWLNKKKCKFHFNSNQLFGHIKKNIEIKDNNIIIAPFSSAGNRDWKPEYFKIIIDQLSSRFKIILIGSLNQKKRLTLLAGKNKNVTVLAGNLKLNEIPKLLANSKLFIGLDSGITHIALKIGIPLIAIIGGGEFGRFFPYRESEKVRFLFHEMDCFLCHWECSKNEKYCLTDVTPEMVINEVNKLLK